MRLKPLARRANPAFVLVLCASLSGAWARPDNRSAISPDALVEHIRILTSEEFGGRRSGERGNVEAARYIAEEFARAGLKPIGTRRQLVADARPDATGYYQPFRFQSGLAPGKGNLLSASVGGRTLRYRLGADFQPVLFSATGQASGEVVFVGYGIRSANPARDDYAAMDVHGKVVLLLDGSPDGNAAGPYASASNLRRKAATARELGAVAVLAVSPAHGRPARSSDTAQSQIPILSIRRSVADAWIREAGKSLADLEKAAAAGPAPLATGIAATLRTVIQPVYTTTSNIVGLLPGSDPQMRAEAVVIGGHMDHLGYGGAGSLAPDRRRAIHPGADDNASGATGVIGLAHYFAEASTRPRRSLLFICFSGEEEGLLGSAAYVRAPIVPLDRTVAMLNMDMIGRMSDDKLTVMGTASSPVWNGLLDDLNRQASFRLTKSPSAFGGSDHQSFYVKGVPVLFFFTGMHPDYHRPSDTVDKINAYDEARVVQFVAAIAERLANDPARPPYQQPPAGQSGDPGARARARVFLGTIPEYGQEVAGVQLAGVRAGSPAEKAGLKAGDILVKLAGRDIGNLQDFMDALADLKPGDVVPIVIKRGGETKTLTATLQAAPSR